jgi:hypothetical protein
MRKGAAMAILSAPPLSGGAAGRLWGASLAGRDWRFSGKPEAIPLSLPAAPPKRGSKNILGAS